MHLSMDFRLRKTCLDRHAVIANAQINHALQVIWAQLEMIWRIEIGNIMAAIAVAVAAAAAVATVASAAIAVAIVVEQV